MSGIYLKGLEMPKDVEILYLQITPSGKVSIASDLKCREIARALPVPDHGRLVDADALEKEHMKRAYENFRSYQFHVSATAWINEAPTIIPADGEEGA